MQNEIGNISKLLVYSLISVFEISVFEISRVDCMLLYDLKLRNVFGAGIFLSYHNVLKYWDT